MDVTFKGDYHFVIRDCLLFCNQLPNFEDFSMFTTNSSNFKVTIKITILWIRKNNLYFWIFLITNTQSFTVFLTHVGIWQMLTWLLTWKAKSLYHVSFFLLTWFFSATSKVQNYQNKTREKSLCPSKYVLDTRFKEFWKYFQIYVYTLFFIFTKL